MLDTSTTRFVNHVLAVTWEQLATCATQKPASVTAILPTMETGATDVNQVSGDSRVVPSASVTVTALLMIFVMLKLDSVIATKVTLVFHATNALRITTVTRLANLAGVTCKAVYQRVATKTLGNAVAGGTSKGENVTDARNLFSITLLVKRVLAIPEASFTVTLRHARRSRSASAPVRTTLKALIARPACLNIGI